MKANHPSPPAWPPAVTLAIVALLIFFWAFQALVVLPWAQRHDVLSFYTGASFALEGRFADLYDPARQLEFQQSIFPGATKIAPYVRPNFYAAAIAPWAALPYPIAFWVWIASHALLLVGAWVLAGRYFGWDAMIWGALYFPTAAGVSNGQDCVWILLIVFAGYVLAHQRRDGLAGAVFGLALFKFNLLVLLPVAMLVSRRRRMLAGYVLSAATAAAAFLALGGLSTLPAYRALLTGGGGEWLEPNPERMINLTAITVNLGLPDAATWVLALLVVGLTVAAVRGAPLWLWISLALLGSVLVNPHAYSYDGGMLLLPVWLALFRSNDRSTRILAATIAMPLPFYTLLAGKPWCALPALLYLALFLSLVRLAWRRRRRIDPVLHTPVRI